MSDSIQPASDHTTLLRRISDTLAGSRMGGADLLLNIVGHAAAALRSAAFLRVLDPNLDGVERDVVAHPDEQVRRRVTAAIARSTQSLDRGTQVREQVIERGELISSISSGAGRPEFLRRLFEQTGWQAEHSVVAPVRHDGAVLGVFSVFRTDPDSPYETGDDDLVQLLADSMGSAIAEGRALTAAENEQRELLEHLAATESRERSMLAEAIHDDPLQLVVAAMLRVDSLRLQQVDPSGDEQLEQVADTLETAVERMRKLIVAVTPPDFAAGLGGALQNLAEGIFSGTSCAIGVVGAMHVTLTESTKSAAYRILREALINVRKHAHAEHVCIRLHEDDTQVTVNVQDDGVGSATIETLSGHLGVRSMRTRAGAENGRLRIDSELGKGTTVTLVLPVAGAPTTPPTALTVFLVDDHEVTRRGITDLLDEEDDLSVVGQASSCAQALELVPALRPDIAVLDVRLPDGSGVELCRQLRAAVPGMNCLMLTSYPDEQAMAESMLAGAGGFVLKDIVGMDLANAVRTVGSGRLLSDTLAVKEFQPSEPFKELQPSARAKAGAPERL